MSGLRDCRLPGQKVARSGVDWFLADEPGPSKGWKAEAVNRKPPTPQALKSRPRALSLPNSPTSETAK